MTMILTPIELNKSEALHNEARTDYSASPQGLQSTSLGSDPIGDPFDTSSPSYASTTGGGMSVQLRLRALGDGAGNHFAEMAFSIEKSNCDCKIQSIKS